MLRRTILIRLLSSPSTSPVASLHRLLSAAAPAVSPNPSFAVEDYLVGTCGLTRAQALKASAKLSHLKSPTNPDAVLAFLTGLSLSSADVASAVAKDPQLLCANVEKTLAPVVAGLAGHGLAQAEIARFVSLGRPISRCRSVVSNLPYYLSLFGSVENLFRFLKKGSGLLGCSLEKVVKPNVVFLRKCGLGDCDISKLFLSTPRLLAANPEHVQAMVASAQGLGVPPGSAMFKRMLQAVTLVSEETIAAKLEYLKNMFRWSDAQVRIAVCKAPGVLTKSKESLQSRSKFLISDVGLAPAYIAQRSVMLTYSLEGRIRPRYYVLKFLKEKGLLPQDRDYYSVLSISEKVFMEKFICPHKEAAPKLAQDYAAACRGKMPTRFRFT
ncbi:transcription termination factor MTEF18, mitochondrial [Lolium perenne]|uniref:transcription termination factor MTEF18, mitochondrial n=1 Tax=Lolium perenne TaxID=4522 RepID=UPI0021F5817F|nr:uncharacterized protein LOC127308988 [Lolium perenne]